MMLHKILVKLRNMIKIAYISLPVDDSNERQILNVSYHGKQVRALNIQPYGHSFNPTSEDTAVALFNIACNDSNTFAICTNYTKRFKNLKPGEVRTGNFETGSSVFYSKDGNIAIEAKGDSIVMKVGTATLKLTETQLISSVPFSAPDYTNTGGGSAKFSAGIDMGGQDVINIGGNGTTSATHIHVDSEGGDTTPPV